MAPERSVGHRARIASVCFGWEADATTRFTGYPGGLLRLHLGVINGEPLAVTAVPERSDPPPTRNWPRPNRPAQVDRICQQDIVGIYGVAPDSAELVVAKLQGAYVPHLLCAVVPSVGI